MRIRNLLRVLSNAIPNRFWSQRHSTDVKESSQLTHQQPAAHQEESPSRDLDELNKRTPAIQHNEDVDLSREESRTGRLEIPFDEIRKAKEERLWKNFKPHAVVVCSNKVPSSIVIYGLSGGERQRIIQFPRTRLLRRGRLLPQSYSAYVRKNLPEEIPFMGKTIGYAVNYSPDHSIEYDLQGKVVCERDSCYEVGEIYLRIRS